MIKDNTISEHDIFNFVFFNDILGEKERKLIESNKENSDLIEFYKKQKAEIETSIHTGTKKKLSTLIPAYKLIE